VGKQVREGPRGRNPTSLDRGVSRAEGNDRDRAAAGLRRDLDAGGARDSADAEPGVDGLWPRKLVAVGWRRPGGLASAIGVDRPRKRGALGDEDPDAQANSETYAPANCETHAKANAKTDPKANPEAGDAHLADHECHLACLSEFVRHARRAHACRGKVLDRGRLRLWPLDRQRSDRQDRILERERQLDLEGGRPDDVWHLAHLRHLQLEWTVSERPNELPGGVKSGRTAGGQRSDRTVQATDDD